jgi:hypothetical protein
MTMGQGRQRSTISPIYIILRQTTTKFCRAHSQRLTSLSTTEQVALS